MIRFKGRQKMKVYVKKKPVKWGFKSYTLCDSENAYNCSFELYTGRAPAHGEHSITHDLVMRLMSPYLHQGYILFTDNYYTSQALALTLTSEDTALVGTVNSNRQGFPEELKNVKTFQRHGDRGDMRYVRADGILYVQWLDKRVVKMLSTFHSATNSVEVRRMVKVDGVWQEQNFRKPEAIDAYNRHMGGVDVFDQLASGYRLLRRSKKYTKVLFYDILEIAVINAFILMAEWRAVAENEGRLPRVRSYAQAEFRENLVRQLLHLIQYGDPPKAKRRRPSRQGLDAEAHDAHVQHCPVVEDRAGCAVCWKLHHKKSKTVFACAKCRNRKGNRVHLCITQDKPCFQIYHSAQFDEYR